MSRVIGLGPAADAFAAALRIPNLLQNLLGEGVLSGFRSFPSTASYSTRRTSAKPVGWLERWPRR